MELAVPLSSFQAHTLPDQREMVTTRLIDPRWVVAFADRLKQVDNYVEVRKKLNLPNPNLDVAKGGAKAAGKGKDKTKGEGDNAQAEAWL